MKQKRTYTKKRELQRHPIKSNGPPTIDQETTSISSRTEAEGVLAHQNLHTSQRQGLIAQVGQIQGNRYIQRFVDYNHHQLEAEGATAPERIIDTLPFDEDNESRYSTRNGDRTTRAT
ncbi:MAG: hypothetical protein KDJ52_05115 [Anaerolineae bacterium]|nr:hypothetical protein [Anaerolineae bacterium]